MQGYAQSRLVMDPQATVDLVDIDHSAAEFPYLQLAAILRARIRDGTYPPGRKIPAIIELEDESGLSTMTVRRAVAVLADEGLVRTVPGRGTFVVQR
jgi:GntR family transcriptional regulator